MVGSTFTFTTNILRILIVKKLFYILFLLTTINLHAQEDDVKRLELFEDLASQYFDLEDDRVHIINFWATWCAPCVKELPYIDAITEKYPDDVKVTLVSLDFPRQVKKRLIPFMDKHQLKSEVVLLEDGKVNDWIDKVDPSWSGAIPATVVWYQGKKQFYEKEFHSISEVEHIIETIKNRP